MKNKTVPFGDTFLTLSSCQSSYVSLSFEKLEVVMRSESDWLILVNIQTFSCLETVSKNLNALYMKYLQNTYSHYNSTYKFSFFERNFDCTEISIESSLFATSALARTSESPEYTFFAKGSYRR